MAEELLFSSLKKKINENEREEDFLNFIFPSNARREPSPSK